MWTLIWIVNCWFKMILNLKQKQWGKYVDYHLSIAVSYCFVQLWNFNHFQHLIQFNSHHSSVADSPVDDIELFYEWKMLIQSLQGLQKYSSTNITAWNFPFFFFKPVVFDTNPIKLTSAEDIYVSRATHYVHVTDVNVCFKDESSLLFMQWHTHTVIIKTHIWVHLSNLPKINTKNPGKSVFALCIIPCTHTHTHSSEAECVGGIKARTHHKTKTKIALRQAQMTGWGPKCTPCAGPTSNSQDKSPIFRVGWRQIALFWTSKTLFSPRTAALATNN